MAILVVAAHPDDEVLGCGGTLARFAKEGQTVHIVLFADGVTSRPQGSVGLVEQELIDARKSAAVSACQILGCSSVETLSLPDNRMDRLELLDVIKKVETYVDRYHPTVIITHHSGDVNIDHRIIHNAVITACRPQPNHFVKELLFFEVPSSTEWMPSGSRSFFEPNVFVDISDTLLVKLRAMKAYDSELRDFPHPRSIEAIKSLASWRGATAGVFAAEAFVLGRKLI